MSTVAQELAAPAAAPAATASAAADLFLGEGRRISGSWQLWLSIAARAALDRICEGDPMAEIVVLQGALALLLHRYGASPVMLLCAPLKANAAGAAGGRMIALHYAVDETMNGRDWLLQSRQVAAAAYDMTQAPSDMRDALAVVKDARVHAPLSVDIPGCLSLTFGHDDPASYRLDDSEGLLPPGFACHFGGHLDAIVEGLAEFGRPISDICLSGADEREALAILGDGGPPAAAADTLVRQFRHWAAATPGATALLAHDQAITYGELELEALRLADRLARRAGTGRGTRVAIAATRSTETIVCFLGAMLAGAAIVPFDPAAPVAAIADMLKDTGATSLLVPADQVELAFEFPDLLAICPALERDGWSDEPGGEGCEPQPGDTAAIIFTSGSEGRPKAVALPHAGLANTVADHVARLGIRPGDRCLQFMAPFFDGGLLDIFTPLSGGATLVCPSAAALADPQEFHAFLAARRVTLITATPAYLAVLDPGRLPDLRAVVSAAESARAADFRRLAGHVALFNGYGPTEASVNTTLYSAPSRFEGDTVPIGRPSAGKRVSLVDSRGRLVPRGVIGEIAISGIGLAEGYLDDPDRTNARFRRGPGGERTYWTGDLAAWDSDGQLHFVGRRDRQVKIGGRRVELGQIERALFDIPRMRDAAVISAEGRLLAFVVRPEAELSGPDFEENVRRRLGTRLPEHMVPAEIHAVEALARKPNGKVDDQALIALARERRASRALFRVRTPVEAALLDIWREALQIGEIDEEADFFRLGGDSIRMIQAVHAARARGLDIHVADLIDHRTLRSLAAALEARSGSLSATAEAADLSLTDGERASLPADWLEAYPVASMQGLMLAWYDEPIAAANAVYHCVAHWRLRDEGMNAEALVTAARALARRHPIIRTRFTRAGASGRVVQKEAGEDEFPLRISDLRGLDPEAAQAAAGRIFDLEGQERFGLDGAPAPFARLHLILRSSEAFDLILAAHHAVMDGWSSVILENDFARYYRETKEGKLDLGRIAPVPSYREFVALDQQAARSSSAASFWRERWRRIPDEKTPRTPAPAGLFGKREGRLPDDLMARLARAGPAGVPPKAACLTAFLMVLEACGRPAPSVGLVANGRTAGLSDPMGATGLFWNVVPFVPAVGGCSLRAVQDELQAMAGHESYPLAKMLSDAGRDQLFDSCFNFIQMHHAQPGFGGVEEIGFEAIDRFHYGLTLFVDHTPVPPKPGCDLRLEYRRDRCSDELADELLAGFIAGLDQVLERGGEA